MEKEVSCHSILNWTATLLPDPETGCSERIGLVKHILEQMTSKELKKISSILSHVKASVRAKEKKQELVAPASAVTVHPVSEIGIPTQKFGFVLADEFPAIIQLEWWKRFEKSDFVGFDVEMVQILRPRSKLESHKAAICAIYEDEKSNLNKKISWKKEEVVINHHTIKVNAITKSNVEIGDSFKNVQAKVKFFLVSGSIRNSFV